MLVMKIAVVPTSAAAKTNVVAQCTALVRINHLTILNFKVQYGMPVTSCIN